MLYFLFQESINTKPTINGNYFGEGLKKAFTLFKNANDTDDDQVNRSKFIDTCHPMPGDTNHLKSGTYCFLAKHSALKGQSMEQFASCHKWRCPVLGEPSPGSVKDLTSLKEIGLCGPLFGCELCHHMAQHHMMRCLLWQNPQLGPIKPVT